jgi:hypothetical protein
VKSILSHKVYDVSTLSETYFETTIHDDSQIKGDQARIRAAGRKGGRLIALCLH